MPLQSSAVLPTAWTHLEVRGQESPANFSTWPAVDLEDVEGQMEVIQSSFSLSIFSWTGPAVYFLR
jgi:hypothetical protein